MIPRAVEVRRQFERNLRAIGVARTFAAKMAGEASARDLWRHVTLWQWLRILAGGRAR